ncbi:hypothetical protein Fcan01_10305 [Folsomia candida]|uniref:Uncharacterized protein n=1 Tax=Folsomia candida TaxID=158441 RepID=A0A226E8M2_FOLCA|nr:hypothetical protein Fcan01_10305 [Folsomia candida]
MLKKDITLVKRNIKYGGYFVCLPIKWDKQHGKVFIFPGAQKLIILSLALNFCVTLCRLLSTMTSSSGLLDRAQAGIGATAFALSFLIRFDIPIDHVPVQLVNLLLKGNGQSGSPRKDSKFQMCLRFLYLSAEATGFLIAAILAALTMISPCQPILLSRLFCTKGNFLGAKSHCITQSFLAIVEIASFLHLEISSVYYLATVLLQGISFLWSSCNDFVASDETAKDNFASFSKYRELKVFEKLLNSCTKSRILLTIALLAPAIQILLGVISIKLFQSGNTRKIEAFLFTWAYILVLIFTMFLFSAAAQINNLSRNWISVFKRKCRNRVERRMHKSLMSLRLEFGNNFVEALTPIVVQEFCVRQTVTSLLITV